MPDLPEYFRPFLPPIPVIEVRPGDVIQVTGCGRDEVVIVQGVRPGPYGSTTLDTLAAPARWPDTGGGDE